MNLDNCKKYINSLIGKNYTFLYKGVRNQNEIFEGVIIKTFPAIFIIKTKDGKTLSFNYNDFIIKNIKILY